jgi:hypothetical protein
MITEPPIPNLEGLTDLAIRTGVDIRPTLLRVLTDLYIQKPTHTADDERHYTELALRLIGEVDIQTKTTVAHRLATHSSAPAAVVRRLVDDLPAIAGLFTERLPKARQGDSIASSTPADVAGAFGAIGRASVRTSAAAYSTVLTLSVETPVPTSGPAPGRPAQSSEHDATRLTIDDNRGTGASDNRTVFRTDADELNELFFAASNAERRLILANLEYVAPPGQRAATARERITSHLLEAAALAHRDDEFIQQLARSLGIGREQALRIVRDESGEPLVVAAKALRMPSDVLQRILLFLNPAIGHSVERVHGLAQLYAMLAPQAADHLAAIWRKSRPAQRATAEHRPHYWDDEVRRPRAQAMADQRRTVPSFDDASLDRRGAR